VTYRVELTGAARETLVHLPPAVKQEVKAALRYLAQNPRGGEPLRRELLGKWKFRIARYRLIYQIYPQDRRLLVVAIGPRRDIYEKPL